MKQPAHRPLFGMIRGEQSKLGLESFEGPKAGVLT
jgi:hypothetical protein